MKTEIEAKFLGADFAAVRKRLEKIGAKCTHPLRLMRRAIFDVVIAGGGSVDKDAFLRLRDEGDKITLTYKRFDGAGLHAAKEISLVVDSFDNALNMLGTIGYTPRSIQESKRETWDAGGVEEVLDEWPWLRPYIEIEGPGVDTVGNIPVVRFGDPLPDLLIAAK